MVHEAHALVPSTLPQEQNQRGVEVVKTQTHDIELFSNNC
jgi:hypothetical protein